MLESFLNKAEEYKESISTLLSIFGVLSIFGLFSSFIIFYKYFDLHNLQLYTPENFVIAMSVVWLVIYISLLFSLIAGWIIGAGEELQDLKNLDKKDQKDLKSKLIIRNLLKIFLFGIILYCLQQILDENTNLYLILGLLILLIISFFIIGLKFTYKFGEKAKVILSFDFLIFFIMSIFFYMFFIHSEEYTFLPILMMTPTLIMIYLLPFLFIEASDTISSFKFITKVYVALTILFIVFMPNVFLNNTIKELHLGNIYYDKLVLHKSECARLEEYNLGYKCDENNTLSNLIGVWIQTEKPIFQKRDMNSTKPEVDKTSSKVWLHKDKIQSVL